MTNKNTATKAQPAPLKWTDEMKAAIKRVTIPQLKRENADRIANNEITARIIEAICDNHGGKMFNILSLSTYVGYNDNCRNRIKQAIEHGLDCICRYCFAVSYTKQRSNLAKKLMRNTDLLTKEIYPINVWPVLPDRVKKFRFESFGDLNNVIQCINYINFCKANENKNHCKFALWTKNPHIVAAALKGIKKPSNLIIIYSSPIINKQVDPRKAYPFIDKIFTVYRRKYAVANGININCGANACDLCGRCYSKHTGPWINEIKK